MKKILFIVLALMSWYQSADAQTTAIPDANFEAKLIALGIDSDGLVNGQILNNDAATVTTLDLSSSNITDLTGIAAFTNLHKLNADQNNIPTFDISQTVVDTLSCVDSRIVTLNLPTSGTIKMLNCTRNQLTSLALAAQPNLQYLDITVNLFTTLSLTNNPLLTDLVASANNLTSIDLTNNTLLTSLIIGLNDLTILDVSNNTALDILNVKSNHLTALNLNTNTALRKLDFSYNDLTTIDLSNQIALEEINIENNLLTQIDFSGSPVLDKAYVNNNFLSSINLTNSTLCTYLDASDNELTTIDLTNNAALIHINLNINKLNAIDVSNNTSLDQLKVSYNQLTTLDLTNNNSMSSVLADVCQLINVALPNSTVLHTVSFNNNLLTSIDVSGCPNLMYLQIGYNSLSTINLTNNPNLTTLYIQDNLLSQLNLSSNSNLSTVFTPNNSPGLWICVSDLALTTGSSWTKDISAIYTIGCGVAAVQINVRVDVNSNCLIDSTELVLADQIIRFERQSDGNTLHFYMYDTANPHPFYLDTGTYVITIANNHPYWQPCVPIQILTIDTNVVLQEVDFSMQAVVSCPLLEVDISAPFLRMTGGGSAYTISYCNTGTDVAQNAYVEVDLDADLNYTGASLPLISQTGTIYRFDVGNLLAGECGSFNVQVVVDTSSLIGQTHCTNVHIYPDTICTPTISVPSVIGSIRCQNDTVIFYLENAGANMLQGQQYEIFEDNVAMRPGVIQLNNGQATTITQAANLEYTYRIEVAQVPNYPAILGDRTFSLAIEGCRPNANGGFSTGFITQFSNGLSQPAQAIDCQQNIAAYDPNDKAAQPAGYGNQHYIDSLTAIDYKVRFQNTGNDTAFNIVILDTLSPLVDIGTLTMGASSHAYNWSIQGGNVLRIDFSNIMLVDSNANEPLSHGFFRYRIAQQPNNALGSVIYNQAAIYFDYNSPIFTNTTFHTIGEDFVTNTYLTLDNVPDYDLNIKAFPNPFQTSTTIAIEGKMFDKLEIQVVDLLGRQVVYHQARQSDRIELQRGNLEQGFYVFQLIGDGELLGTGKLKVE